MNLTDLKFIPKSSTRSNTPSLDDLVSVKPEINWSMKKSGENTYHFKSTFLVKEKDWGYTLATFEENGKTKVLLLRVRVDENIEEARPKFLIGDTTTTRVVSNYVELLISTYFPNTELFSFNLIKDNLWEVVPATEEVEEASTTILEPLVQKQKFNKLSDFNNI